MTNPATHDALFMIAVDVRRAIAAGIAYAALATTLTIPDICAALEADNGRATKGRYIDWYDCWIAHRFDGTFSGAACYSLRCGFVHQGHVSLAGSIHYDRAVFHLPGMGGKHHNNRYFFAPTNMIEFQLEDFCAEFLLAMDEWRREKRYDQAVKANMKRLVRLYNNGAELGAGSGPTIA